MMFFILALSLHQKILHTSSFEELKEVKKSYIQNQTSYHLCQRQIKNKKIPEHCYIWMEQDSYYPKNFKNLVDQKCQSVEIASLELEKTSLILKRKNLSPSCHQFLEKMLPILEYKSMIKAYESFL